MASGAFPPVALTCGDPAGIGPEISLLAWQRLGATLPFFWIGDPAHLPEGAAVRIISAPDEAIGAVAAGLPVLPHAFGAPAIPGRPSPENARGVVEVIERAVELVRNGEASAICTAPIAKKELVDHAGFGFPGHTEFLAHLAGADRVVMMLAAAELKVVPATIHIPLAEVATALTPDVLEAAIEITAAALKTDFGIAAPRIAVAGLNPHAGEAGLLGREEIDWIAGLCDRLRARGLDLIGPLPADTMFHAAARSGYDAAIAMYHDQALIPIKTLAFERGVNVTLGLPFVRTSPDHGTAFDIAGRGLADPTSLIEALKLAEAMARTRAGQKGS
ncbi:MAG: 4-hydroxythreonine-4-phosphate dehydrogenase PdxA [Silicimonas sp.]|nr:4-hydroxythreonine-4-phosphate dehydrogenase PdxA [Silicimonas sp.]NNL35455.1 4-hydroxythreonine-4-phosphate dehydrogenase PdxA [Silicimonas sp.]